MQWLRVHDLGDSVLYNLDTVEEIALGGGEPRSVCIRFTSGRREVWADHHLVEVITDKAELDLQLTGVDPDDE